MNEKGSRAFLYIGSERLLDTFVIPNIGTDFNLYFCNEKNLEQTAKIAVEPVSIRQTNKVLMQRYQSLAQVSEAQVIGILVGTVVVSDYQEIIDKLKIVINASGKKCYEVLVGKLNEPKLKNLPSIEMYVYVGCRETSLISSREFMMPVCTPHELLMALLPERFPWQSKIITDF